MKTIYNFTLSDLSYVVVGSDNNDNIYAITNYTDTNLNKNEQKINDDLTKQINPRGCEIYNKNQLIHQLRI